MKESQEQQKVSRRGFLKGAGLVAAGATATAATGCNTRQVELRSPTPAPTRIPLVEQYPAVPYTPVEPPARGLLQVFTPHEARTVEAVTARILPGTPDDPGAREAGVVYYIDNMLAFNEGFNEHTYRHPPYAQIYSGDSPPTVGVVEAQQAAPHGEGPPTPTPTLTPTPAASVTPSPAPSPSPTPTITPAPADADALTSTAGITGTARLTNDLPVVQEALADLPESYQIIWVPASEIYRYGYQSILSPRDVYRIGIAALDRYTGSQFGVDFVALSAEQQDQVIGAMADDTINEFDKNLSAQSFFHNLRRHTAEGMFSDPVYGGNRNLVGWRLVGYPGAQRAYQPYEFQQEGTWHEPQSIAHMHWFNPGHEANEHVLMPVIGSDEDHDREGER